MKLNTLHTLAAAIALTLLGSCSSDEVLKDSDGSQRIVFSVATENASRAVDGGYFNSTTPPGNFYAWAKVNVASDNASDNKLKNYFQYQDFAKQGETSTYINDLPYFWPKNTADQLHIYAINVGPKTWLNHGWDGHNFKMFETDELNDPNDATKGKKKSVMDTTGFYHEKKLTFFQLEGNYDQYDLLYAYTIKSRPDNGVAQLNFRHALSQICFKITNKMPHTYIEPIQVGIANTAIKASMKITGVTDVHNSPAYSCEWFDYKYDGLSDIENIDTKQNNFHWGLFDIDPHLMCNDILDLTDPKYAMLLIPQKWNPTTAYNPSEHVGKNAWKQMGTFIEIICRIRNLGTSDTPNNAVDEYILGSAGDYTKDEEKACRGRIAIPQSFAWEPGKRYIYNITFTAGGTAGYDVSDGKPAIVPIKLTVQVEDFSNGGEHGADIFN